MVVDGIKQMDIHGIINELTKRKEQADTATNMIFIAQPSRSLGDESMPPFAGSPVLTQPAVYVQDQKESND